MAGRIQTSEGASRLNDVRMMRANLLAAASTAGTRKHRAAAGLEATASGPDGATARADAAPAGPDAALSRRGARHALSASAARHLLAAAASGRRSSVRVN